MKLKLQAESKDRKLMLEAEERMRTEERRLQLEEWKLQAEMEEKQHQYQSELWRIDVVEVNDRPTQDMELMGKAQKLFAELSVNECQDYDTLLTAYARVPNFYQKMFQTMVKCKMETYSNLVFWLNMPFQRLLEGKAALQDINWILKGFKLEQTVYQLSCIIG